MDIKHCLYFKLTPLTKQLTVIVAMLWSSVVIAHKRVEQQGDGIGELAFFDQKIYPNIKTSPSPK